MKKLLFALSFLAISSFSFASTGAKYRVNDADVDQLFSASKDISASATDEMVLINTGDSKTMTSAGGDQGIGGFLIRTFFCGFIWLHRSYMGGSGLGWKYCVGSIFLASIPQAVDFWWVLLSGNDALSKYKGTDKFIVWL